ncbi:CobW family GTP-binding protein [Streptomyces sp. AN091965]|uniref:CobW family GTP-binding protein n=1 Tax=Streptomyces sp. AN091965 TaxID=2927803 RepID=UPI001F61CA4F|nr:CobW family GTP-binding protein [Streptomyces sp. AN091965]MCI3933533.1 GTP-binding protein [Streptomyces sp. AN091965]
MREQQIPVVVLTGFLGSGKTTLLNHLLHRSGGSRIGAIVNDFGSIEIDAMAVAGQLGDSTVSLGNGCLCCAVDASELDVYLERLARPSSRIDVIVIEASGLAEPQELVRMVLASENPHIVYGGLVQVVDAAEFDATRQRHPEVDRHLKIADLVVVNKADRVPTGERDRVLDEVRRHTDRAAVVAATYGRVDVELLLDRKPVGERVGQLSFDDLHDHGEDPYADGGPREADGGPETGEECHCGDPGHLASYGDPGNAAPHGDPSNPASHGDVGRASSRGGCGHTHLHSAYESLAFTSEAPMNPRRLMAFLDSRPEGLYRIKGYVDFGAADARNRYAVHSVGRFLRYYPEPWESGEKRLTQLVLIGSGIDVPELHTQLTLCRENDEDAPHADEFGMWGVLRYVQEPGAEETPGAEGGSGSGTGAGPEADTASSDATAGVDLDGDVDGDAEPDAGPDPYSDLDYSDRNYSDRNYSDLDFGSDADDVDDLGADDHDGPGSAADPGPGTGPATGTGPGR